MSVKGVIILSKAPYWPRLKQGSERKKIIVLPNVESSKIQKAQTLTKTIDPNHPASLIVFQMEMEEGVNGGISGAEGATDFQALYAMAAQNAKVSTILGRLKEGTEGTVVLVGR